MLEQAAQLLLAPAALRVPPARPACSPTFTCIDVDYADLYFQYSRLESWSLEEGIVKSGSFQHRARRGRARGGGEKTAFAYSDDISLAALARGGDRDARDRAAGPVGGRRARRASAAPRALYPPRDPVAALTDERKVALLERLERLARARDPRVTQVMASLAGEYEAVLIARSDGLIAADVRPLVRLSLTVIVEENGRREQGMRRRRRTLRLRLFHRRAAARNTPHEAVDQALLNLGARDAPAGTMTVVLGHGWPGILLHEAIGHGLEGDFNRKGTEAFSGRVGERVAAQGVTVVDDGTIAERRGSLNIDDEGNPTQRTVLIEDGMLKGYMQDTLNARLMGVRRPATAGANRSRTCRCRA